MTFGTFLKVLEVKKTKSETSFGGISQNDNKLIQSLPSTDLLALVISAWERTGR